MATFTPGDLHIERHALHKNDVSYDLHIVYEVVKDPKEGKGMLFKLHGSVEGKELNESFYLPKDQACNFASNVTKILERHGISKAQSSLGSNHKYYDKIFEDVRVQLDMKSGDLVNPEHFE